MKKLRILLLAPDTNPDFVAGPLIGYFHGEALARLHSVTLVVRSRNEAAIRRAGAPFRAIEAIGPSWLERAYRWMFERIFKSDRGNLLWVALTYPLPVEFEWRVWRRLRARVRSGDFDVVLRILPIVPMMPSPFAFFLRKGPVPFVIGPLNGGAPWPVGFSQLDRQRAAAGNWVANLRGAYRYLPFARSTYAEATAIVAGSSHTYAELGSYRDKLFFVPGENGLNASFFHERQERGDRRLHLIYVGRLVPYKACDLAIRGAAPLLRDGIADFTVVGDGPELGQFEGVAEALGVRDMVSFVGFLSRDETLSRMREADVLVFPSLREFGGGVVFEALGLGVVPVVAANGGPGDIVTSEVGYKIPLVGEAEMASEIELVLRRLASDRSHLERLRRQAITYAREHLTWDAKARKMTEILNWATGNGVKPRFLPPSTVAG